MDNNPNQCSARKGRSRCCKLFDLHTEHHDLHSGERWGDQDMATHEHAGHLLRLESLKDPKQRFAELVKSGIINREGQLTKQYGGEADPEDP